MTNEMTYMSSHIIPKGYDKDVTVKTYPNSILKNGRMDNRTSTSFASKNYTLPKRNNGVNKSSNHNSMSVRSDMRRKSKGSSKSLTPKSKSSSVMQKYESFLMSDDNNAASFTSFDEPKNEDYKIATNHLFKSSISETEGEDDLHEILFGNVSVPVLDDRSNDSLIEKASAETRNDSDIIEHLDVTPPSNNLRRRVKKLETRETSEAMISPTRQALDESQQPFSSSPVNKSKVEPSDILQTQSIQSLRSKGTKKRQQQQQLQYHLPQRQPETLRSREVNNKSKEKKDHKQQTQLLNKKKYQNQQQDVINTDKPRKLQSKVRMYQLSSELQADEKVKLHSMGPTDTTESSLIQNKKTNLSSNEGKEEKKTVTNTIHNTSLSKPKKQQKRRHSLKPSLSCVATNNKIVANASTSTSPFEEDENVDKKVLPPSCLRGNNQKESSLVVINKRNETKESTKKQKLKKKSSSLSFRPTTSFDKSSKMSDQDRQQILSNVQRDNLNKVSPTKDNFKNFQSSVQGKVTAYKGLSRRSINQKDVKRKSAETENRKTSNSTNPSETDDNVYAKAIDNDGSVSTEPITNDASGNNVAGWNISSSLGICHPFSQSNFKDFEDSIKIKAVNNILNCASPTTVENEDVQESRPHVMDAFRNPYLYNKLLNDDAISSSAKINQMGQAITTNQQIPYMTSTITSPTTNSKTTSSNKKNTSNKMRTNENCHVDERKDTDEKNVNILTELKNQNFWHSLTSSSINDKTIHSNQNTDHFILAPIEKKSLKPKVAVQNHVLNAVVSNSPPDETILKKNKKQLPLDYCHEQPNRNHRSERSFSKSCSKDVDETGCNAFSAKNVSFGTDHKTALFCTESFAIMRESESLECDIEDNSSMVSSQSHRPKKASSQSFIERSTCGVDKHAYPGMAEESILAEHEDNQKSTRILNNRRGKSPQKARSPKGYSSRRSLIERSRKSNRNVAPHEEEAGLKNLAVSYNEIGNAKNVLSLIGYTHKPSVEDGFSVIIKVEASTVSRIDCEMRRNVFLKATPLPFSPGIDCVGTVHRVGAKAYVDYNIAEGDRVATLSPYLGANSRYVSVHAKDIVKVPKRLDSIDVTCIMSSYIVAYQSLYRIGNFELKRGDRVLVTGANGSIGRAVIELSLLGGARDVYAVAHKRHQKLLEGMGAIHVHSSRKDGFRLFPEIDGKIDVVIDTLGGMILRKCCETLDAKRGRLISIGMASSVSSSGIFGMPLSVFVDKAVVQWKTKLLFSEQVLKYDLFKAWKTEKNDMIEDLQYLFHLLSRRDIKPLIARVVSLQGVADAHVDIENGTNVGHIVCTPWKKLKKHDKRMQSQRVEYKKENASKVIEKTFHHSGLTNQLCRVSL